MEDLDGVWELKRLSGALPPLGGVTKRISGVSGETKLGPLPGAPFDVIGDSLCYRGPFRDFVDELTPDGQGFRGRATYRGRAYGTFLLRRSKPIGGQMAGLQLKDQLIKHIDEAFAMEQSVLRMLEGMIETMEEPGIRDELRQHKLETERHAERMAQRLEAHGASPSLVREKGGIFGARLKSVVDRALGDQAGRNARHGYATEHLEIASYQLLERIAQKASDEETAEAARQNRADEEAMVRKLDARWDTFTELSLREDGPAA